MKTNQCRWLWAVVFIACFSPVVASAQEPPESQYEHIKAIEPFIGWWGMGDPDSDDPGSFYLVARWGGNKSYGMFNFWMMGDQRTHVGTINVGWDGAEKKLALWSFFPDGQATASPSVNDTTMSWSSKGVSSNGEATSGDVTMKVDGDELIISIRNGVRGGEPQPDMDITLKRRERRRP